MGSERREGRAVVDPQALLDSPAVRRVAATAARTVQPPEPAIDADLLAALRSALAEGVGVEELIAAVGAMIDAKVRGLPAAAPSRSWTFCADSLPAEAGRYELAYVVRGERRRAFALWGAPRDLPPVWSLPGIGGWVAGAYAWRPIVEDPPALRPADRVYLATQGVPAERLGTPEED